MSCPLNRNRWAGSGYVKPTAAASPAAKELEARLLEMQASRNIQDVKYSFSPASKVTEPCKSVDGVSQKKTPFQS